MGLLGWIKRLAGLSKDKNLQCVECKKPFLFEEGEQAFFSERGLTAPKRCPGCRKQSRRGRGGRRR